MKSIGIYQKLYSSQLSKYWHSLKRLIQVTMQNKCKENKLTLLNEIVEYKKQNKTTKGCKIKVCKKK